MDDNTLRAQFTVGETIVTASQPTAEQMFVLQLTRQSSSAKEGVRTARRLVRILENLLGQDQWDDVMDAGLIGGTITVEQMMILAKEIFTFDWAALTETKEAIQVIAKDVGVPLGEDSDDDALADFLAAGD